MYVSKLNAQQDLASIKQYVEENGFATIISLSGYKPIATHVPLILTEEDGKSYFTGHISIANEQSQAIKNKESVLAIFMEKHTYISSSWYDHVNVPTWNYIAVHVYGTFEELSEEEKLSSLNQMVSKYEKYSDKPFSIAQMPEKMKHMDLKGITAFKITIDKIEASWKLSQNRDDKNYHLIIEQLLKRGDAMSLGIAEEMKNARKITTP
ncbi:MAG: Protease synthase and sporulation protein 2 [Bacteroidota bacterium]|jgi:transcriptional regulator